MRQGVRFGVVLGAALLLPVVATACSSGSSTAPLTAQQKSYVTSVRGLFSQDGTGHAGEQGDHHDRPRSVVNS